MAAGGLVPRQKGAGGMNWIPITAKNKKDIHIGDFISATYGKGIIYKVLGIEYHMKKMFLDVGVCDEHGNMECDEWIYKCNDIICFDCYSPQNRRATVV